MWVRDDSYDLEDNDVSIIEKAIPEPQKALLLSRLVNFLVDTLAYLVAITVFLFLYLGRFMTLSTDVLAYFSVIFVFFLTPLGLLMLGLFIFCSGMMFFTIIEASTCGRSLGKWMTGTKAVEADGTPLTYKSAALRSLCRFIPFEGLGAFWSAPLHDTLTRTKVVNT